MEFRLANVEDLPQIKLVYKEIIKNMYENQIDIWDDIYPCDFFEKDIIQNRMYLLFDKDVLVSAFVLCDRNEGAKSLIWESRTDKVLYLEHLGVNIKYIKKGIGSIMLLKAKEVAKNLGVEYLRLFVVDINKPAINLYIKNGFIKAKGIYNEIIDNTFILHEYGYEIKI